MVFHQPFLNLIANELPNTDVLLGKPMPVAAAARFYEQHTTTQFDAASSAAMASGLAGKTAAVRGTGTTAT